MEQRSARSAWTALVMSPIGVVVGIGVPSGVAALIVATLDPAGPQHRTAARNVLCFGAATVVVVAAPISGVALALPPAREGSRSGRLALATGIALTLVALGIMVPSLVSW